MHSLFFGNMCGWPFALNGAAVGVGMAMITNRVRAVEAWKQFLRVHSERTMTTFREAREVLWGLITLGLPYSWPLFLALLASTLVGLVALDCGGTMKPSIRPWPDVIIGGMVKARSVESTPRKELSAEELSNMQEWVKIETLKNKGQPLSPAQIQQAEQDGLNDLAKGELRAWKISTFGRATGLGADSLTKVIGAFFAVMGMGFGNVVLLSGINIEPRRKVG
jgi:hypothetical protein